MTAETKAYFGFPRRTDSFTFSGGNWNSLYPVTNLGLLPLSQVARSFDLTTPSTVILGTASSVVSVGGIALVGHNGSASATIRVQAYSDSFTTQVYDSGVVNMWVSAPSSAEVADTVPMRILRFTAAGAADLSVLTIRIDINDSVGGADYFQAGFCEIFSALDLTYNFSRGSEWGFRWRSQPSEGPGGAIVVDDRIHPRVFRGAFNLVTHSQAMSKFYEMQRQHRNHQPVVFAPLPDDTTQYHRLNMFARMVDPGFASYRGAISSGVAHSIPLALEEIIG